MPAYRILFGQIAQEKGLLSKEQVDECVEAQKTMPGCSHLGEVALRKGYIDEEGLVEVLTEQILRFYREEPRAEVKLGDHIFGQLCVEAGYLDFTDLHDALREQALLEKRGEFKRLGEVLVSRGKLVPRQVADILERQKVSILLCETCVQPYNVPRYRSDMRYICKVCGSFLVKPQDATKIAVRGALHSLAVGSKDGEKTASGRKKAAGDKKTSGRKSARRKKSAE